MRALIVEDDKDLAAAIGHILKREGYASDTVFNGKDGLDYAQSGGYDVMVFDVMLPEIDGFSAVRKLRGLGVKTPILMLTAKGEIPDRIEGLDSGADSYMTKPFSVSELAARLRALTRRNVAIAEDRVCVDDTCLRRNDRVLSCGGEEIRLSNKEFLLADMLMSNPNSVFSRSQIRDRVWGFDSDATDNNVEAYVSMLRRKLEFLGSPLGIKADRGIGYKLVRNSDGKT